MKGVANTFFTTLWVVIISIFWLIEGVVLNSSDILPHFVSVFSHTETVSVQGSWEIKLRKKVSFQSITFDNVGIFPDNLVIYQYLRLTMTWSPSFIEPEEDLSKGMYCFTKNSKSSATWFWLLFIKNSVQRSNHLFYFEYKYLGSFVFVWVASNNCSRLKRSKIKSKGIDIYIFNLKSPFFVGI